MLQTRKIERYSLCCPILLSPVTQSVKRMSLLSRTENVSSRGAYVCGSPQWFGHTELLISIFYEVSYFLRQNLESRFLIRFRGEVARQDEQGFALKFSSTDVILPLSRRRDMTAMEADLADLEQSITLEDRDVWLRRIMDADFAVNNL